jgi:hypothetical protein
VSFPLRAAASARKRGGEERECDYRSHGILRILDHHLVVSRREWSWRWPRPQRLSYEPKDWRVPLPRRPHARPAGRTFRIASAFSQDPVRAACLGIYGDDQRIRDHATRDLTHAAQVLLNELGYSPSLLGEYDARTAAAVRSFQRSANLEPDGGVSAYLVLRLAEAVASKCQ